MTNLPIRRGRCSTANTTRFAGRLGFNAASAGHSTSLTGESLASFFVGSVNRSHDPVGGLDDEEHFAPDPDNLTRQATS
jgi:hypothetical protein